MKTRWKIPYTTGEEDRKLAWGDGYLTTAGGNKCQTTPGIRKESALGKTGTGVAEAMQ